MKKTVLSSIFSMLQAFSVVTHAQNVGAWLYAKRVTCISITSSSLEDTVLKSRKILDPSDGFIEVIQTVKPDLNVRAIEQILIEGNEDLSLCQVVNDQDPVNQQEPTFVWPTDDELVNYVISKYDVRLKELESKAKSKNQIAR